jgi:hypothetical protein
LPADTYFKLIAALFSMHKSDEEPVHRMAETFRKHFDITNWSLAGRTDSG